MQTNVEKAMQHLAAHDPVIAALIVEHGPYTPRPHTDYYQGLVTEIIGQQISIKAAAAIRRRFVDLFGGQFPTPEQIIAKDAEQLRGVGLSYAKAAYVNDVAKHILEGSLHIERLPELSNEEVMKELIAVKGIGEWTAHMFLMFNLGRLDILPVGDLGLRNGLQKLYGFDHLPNTDEMRDLATKNHWSPYESVATWYVWEALDNKPIEATEAAATGPK